MELKCLVVDDDPVICELLNSYIEKVDHIHDVTFVHNGSEAKSFLAKEKFDLLFLDLNLPGVSGQELIKHCDPDLPVVLVTSDPDFALESYNYNVVGYLLKPITFPRFLKTVQKLEKDQSNLAHIIVKDGSSKVRINLNELKFIKSESNYVAFHMINQRVMSLMRISDLIDLLPEYFVRVHRSYIVNSSFVDSVGNSTVGIGDLQIPVSNKYKENLSLLLKS